MKAAREEKGCKSELAFLSLCPKLVFLSKRGRGGPSGKSAGGDRQPERVQDCNIFLAPASNIQGVWKTLGSSLEKLVSRLFEVLERLPNERIIIRI